MEHLFSGIAGVVVYLDDILVTGEDDLKTLEEVFKRLSEANLRVKKEKCLFLASSVVFLSHKIDADADGLHPLQDKIEAIEAAPIPSAYLGLLTYYSKFLPSRLTPLYELLKKDVKWKWTAVRDRAFQESKKLLSSEALLAWYDPRLPLTLACDASAYGIGAHRLPDGSNQLGTSPAHSIELFTAGEGGTIPDF